MKYCIITIILLAFCFCVTTKAEIISKDKECLKIEVDELKDKQKYLYNEINILSSKNAELEKRISNIKLENKKILSDVDSLLEKYNMIVATQKADKSEITNRISRAMELVQTTHNLLSSRTLWTFCGFFTLLSSIAVVVFGFLKRFKSEAVSIGDVRKAQEALKASQNKMQEESIKLDDKLLELFDRQIANAPKNVGNEKPDHTLALKVADEIVRIELNMSRMDSSIKGYKQLAKAVERIKDNFKANGYEIVDMLGKPYNEGMKVIANFVVDEDLEEGKQIITGITKPQINYNGQMIQAAQITVSQNI